MSTSQGPVSDPIRDWFDGRLIVPAIAWHDDDLVGHDPTDRYVDTFWLPILGPSATWAIRHLTTWLAEAPASGIQIPVEPFARSLGIPVGGRHGRGRHTLARLVRFDLARIDFAYDVLAVRTRIPHLTPSRAANLPAHLQVLHAAEATPRRRTGSSPEGWRREAPPRPGDPTDGRTPLAPAGSGRRTTTCAGAAR